MARKVVQPLSLVSPEEKTQTLVDLTLCLIVPYTSITSPKWMSEYIRAVKILVTCNICLLSLVSNAHGPVDCMFTLNVQGS